MKGRLLLRIFIAAALVVILTAVLPFVLGCSKLAPTRPATAPATDKGVRPPLYQPGLPDQAVDVQTEGQAECSGELENPNEPIAPET